MKTVRQTRKYNLVSIVKRIQMYFGNENLFFTFSPFEDDRLHHLSTFGRDNINNIERWLVTMQAKLFSENIDIIVMAVRIFLPDSIIEDSPKGKIPRKDLYYFGFTKDQIMLFDENETYDSQNIDAFTGERLEHEEGLVYRSSIELYDFLVSLKDKYNNDDLKDEPLEPIIINLDDILCDPAPEEFTKLKERALNCTNPEEAFKLRYEFRKWNPDRFHFTEYDDVLRNYEKAIDKINQIIEKFLIFHNIKNNKYRDVTHTHKKDLKDMLQRYQEAKIIKLGSMKILIWKSTTPS